MSRSFRRALGASVIAVLVVGPAAGSLAGPNLPPGCTKVRGTIVCETEGKNKNWTTTTSKKGSFQSSHEEEQVNRNKGGNAPPGQN